jgi:hypothetical protein
MRRNGASDEEIEFLLERRDELNAMTSDQFVEFIESGLTEHGVDKVVPSPDLLAETNRARARAEQVRKIVERAISEAEIEDVAAPDNLADQVADLLRRHPSRSWNVAVAEIAGTEASEI